MAAFHMSTKNEALISDDRLSKIERIQILWHHDADK